LNGTAVSSRPRAATQRARQAALPDGPTLAAGLAAAGAGLPFRDGAFQPFLDDVAAAREARPLTVADLDTPLVRARVGALLFERPDGWEGLVLPTGLHDPRRVAAALRDAGVTYLDMTATANGIVATYTRSALRWLGIGAAVAACVLLIGLRSLTHALRVLGSIAGAVLLTVALLTAAGAPLSLISIVSLQFVAGVGLDYALFFARRQLDVEERARTLRTLAICNAMAVTTFGLLALCQTPLLRDIGRTVAIGTVAALVCGFLFAGPRPGRDAA
jgi:predicted exporter